jgi:hypothetical protein
MLGNQRFGIGRCLLQRSKIVRPARVAQCHADIPQKSPPLDSLDGRIPEQLAESRVIKC